jgi:predicted enzyme related to lactoylglutathione lyase
MGNPVLQWQILTKQPEKLEEFYTKLFGWKVSDDNALGYRRVDTSSEEGIHGGLWPISEKEGHSMVQLFIRVGDVKAHAVTAQELGARILIPPQSLPDGDEVCIAMDPDGIPFGMFRGRQTPIQG